MFVTSRYGPLAGGISNTLSRLKVDYIQVPLWNMEESIEQFHPQSIIFFHHFLKEWDKSVLDRLDAIKCHKMLWDWECPWEIDYIRQYHHFFSKVLIQDKSSVESLLQYDKNKFIHVPHAADKDLAKPMKIPFEYRSDLCFIGAAYPSRLKFFREVLPQLKDYKVVVGGSGWEFLPDIEGQHVRNVAIGGDDYLRYYMGAKVALNLHRLSNEMPISNTGMIEASSPNNRFFELNMMGCYQVVDDVRSPELETYYDIPPITFSNSQEFIDIFKTTMQGESREIWGNKIQKETLENHSYENRFIELIAPLI